MKCLKGAPWKLYISRAVSSWGDRMWSFAIGLFMIQLTPDSLKWPAIYGLSTSITTILLAPLVGHWVDKTLRLRAAQISLVSQNACVVLCSICVALTFHFRVQIETQVGSWAVTLCFALIVALGSAASLASTASAIVVNKDWIVVIAAGDKDLLARMNSTCRSIDLATNILAPIVVGQVLHFLAASTSAVILATWNVGSFFFEYLLLEAVYKRFPALAVKNRIFQDENEQLADGEERPRAGRCSQMWSGWAVYMADPVRNAGLGLACLYMTVLGFDSITSGYAYSQGVPESVLGGLAAAGALVGLLGSVTFPALVRCLDVRHTGIVGFGFELACLTLCVASVWAPGSVFDASALIQGAATEVSNATAAFNETGLVGLTAAGALNETWTVNATDASNATSATSGDSIASPDSYISVVLLLAGIVSARFGLWLADLSVNQVLQGVAEDVRGTVNGVQSSVNMVMDTAKFLLVIALPRPATFGYLVCFSFVAVFIGGVLFTAYAFAERRHTTGLSGRRGSLSADTTTL